MGSRRYCRRAGVAAVLAMSLLGAGIGLAACGIGGESPANRPSAGASERSLERPASGGPDATRSREVDETTEPTKTTKPRRRPPS